MISYRAQRAADLTIDAGVLVIWHDVAPGHETAIEHWYNSEHHFERLGIPGFFEATRYQSLDTSSRRYMCLYLIRDPAVLLTTAYLTRVNNPTPWTQTVMPLYRNFSRTVCRIFEVSGRAHGGYVATLGILLDPGPADGLDPDLAKRISAHLLDQPGILRCRWLARTDRATAPASSTESQLRGRPDQQIDAAILIDANHKSQADNALAMLETLLNDASLSYSVRQRGSYQQVYSLA